MSKTAATAAISTQCGFTNGAPVNSNICYYYLPASFYNSLTFYIPEITIRIGYAGLFEGGTKDEMEF